MGGKVIITKIKHFIMLFVAKFYQLPTIILQINKIK